MAIEYCFCGHSRGRHMQTNGTEDGGICTVCNCVYFQVERKKKIKVEGLISHDN